MNTATIGNGNKVHYVSNGRTLCGAGRNSKIGSKTWTAAHHTGLNFVEGSCTCERCNEIANGEKQIVETEVEPIIVPLIHFSTRTAVYSLCRKNSAKVEYSDTEATIQPNSQTHRNSLVEQLKFQRIIK